MSRGHRGARLVDNGEFTKVQLQPGLLCKLALRALYTERLRFLRVPSETIDERIAAFKQWGKPTESTFRFLEDRLRELSPKPVPSRARARPPNPARAVARHMLVFGSWTTGVLVRASLCVCRGRAR